VFSTLAFIGSLADGAHVVFDYSDPLDTLALDARALHDRRAARVHAAGEAWMCHFEPRELQGWISDSPRSKIWDQEKLLHDIFQTGRAPHPKEAATS
jgi:hypothetical protein